MIAVPVFQCWASNKYLPCWAATTAKQGPGHNSLNSYGPFCRDLRIFKSVRHKFDI